MIPNITKQLVLYLKLVRKQRQPLFPQDHYIGTRIYLLAVVCGGARTYHQKRRQRQTLLLLEGGQGRRPLLHLRLPLSPTVLACALLSYEKVIHTKILMRI